MKRTLCFVSTASNGMDVWSTTDPEEIKRAIESLLRGGSFQYNNNWIRKSDEDFLDPDGEAYSAGLNYNSRTGQLWFLDNYGVGGSIVSQLTWVPGKGFIEYAVGRYEFESLAGEGGKFMIVLHLRKGNEVGQNRNNRPESP